MKGPNGKQRPVDWPEALSTFASRFKAIQAQHGPGSIAWLGTGYFVMYRRAVTPETLRVSHRSAFWMLHSSGALLLAAGMQALARDFANRLQHREPRLIAGPWCALNEMFAHQ